MRLLFIAIILTFNISAYAAILIVPDDYVTIQSAVDAAYEDDIVTVRAGTYYGSVHIFNKNISLKSISGADSTIIDGQNDSNAVTFNLVGSSTVLDGFTLTNGLIRGIYINGSPTVRNCIIVNNDVFNNTYSTGIRTGLAGTIENCIIKNNIGSGITIGSGHPTIKGCEINNNGNIRPGLGGGGVYVTSSAKIENSTISNNCASLSTTGCSG